MTMRLSFFQIVFFGFCLMISSGNQDALAQSAFDDPGARTGGGDLAVVDNNIDAGVVALGASSQVVVLFRNDSSKNITMSTISLYPSSNVSASVSENECSTTPLSPSAVCAVALSIKGLQPGNFRVEMLMRHDGKSKLITAAMSGIVDTADDEQRRQINDLETIPESLDFGTLTESRPLTRSIILRNVTSKPITVDTIDIESNEQAGYSLKTSCDLLASGAACVATVTWAPQQRGPATGALVVNHDGPTGVVSVILDGEYNPVEARQVGVFPEAVPGKGLLTASQTEINFGSDIEAEAAITVSMVNVGDAPLKIENIRMAGEDTGVKIAANGCKPNQVLQPVEACPLTLKWEPVREGSIIDDVQILHDGARGILVLPVTGSATQAVNRDSQSIVFGEGGALETIPAISSSDLDDRTPSRQSNPRGSLEGYKVTSIATNRAIVAGPGGSRVVYNGEETVIGGVLWQVQVQRSAVKFINGPQKILLLFDKSLSGGRNGGGSSTAAPVPEGGA